MSSPCYRRAPAASMLDPLKRVVDEWLARTPPPQAKRIHQDLVRDYGFTGSYQTVCRDGSGALRVCRDSGAPTRGLRRCACRPLPARTRPCRRLLPSRRSAAEARAGSLPAAPPHAAQSKRRLALPARVAPSGPLRQGLDAARELLLFGGVRRSGAEVARVLDAASLRAALR